SSGRSSCGRSGSSQRSSRLTWFPPRRTKGATRRKGETPRSPEPPSPLRPRASSPTQPGGPAAAHLVEEPAPQIGVLAVEPAPERRHRAGAFLLDAAHLRAEMRSLDVHRDAARSHELEQSVRDLLAEALLHREAARIEPDESRQLRDAEDLAIR